jgi:uncharacterized protein (TIGR02594 family)
MENHMVASSYGEALARLLVHEGGNDDDPRDPGGRTSRGILQREWDVWRRTRPGLPADVWRAPQDQIEAIYRQNYWDALRCDDLPAGVDYAVFDYGVNSGITRVAKVLQRMIDADLAVDGEIGPETIAAARAAPAAPLVARICDERLAFLQGLRTWPTFGRGWSRRVQEVRAAALAMASNAKTAAPPDRPGAAVPPPDMAPSGGWLSAALRAITALFKPAAQLQPAKRSAQPVSAGVERGPPWLVKAEAYLGFHERGDNRGIEEFIALAKAGRVGDPWCAIFVNACLEAVGVRGTRSAMARSFERDGNFVKLAGPALGAITTMWRGSPSSGSGHVFFYLGENGKGVLALGGNQSDQVRRQYEPPARVTGYWWPKTAPVPKVGKIAVRDDGAPIGGGET